MKKIRNLSIIFLTIGLGIFLLFIFTGNKETEKKLRILDCQASYKIPKSKDLDYSIISEINLQSEVGVCLCEKYMESKETKYKKEILELFENYKGVTIIPDAIYKNPKYKVDSICKYRDMVFAKGVEL